MDTASWWNQVGVYNKAVFPMQIVFWVIAAVLIYFLVFKPSRTIDKVINGYLSLLCAWNALVFFLIYGRQLPGTVLGAPLFILAAILFAWDIKGGKTHFRIPEATWQKLVTAGFIVCALLYPFIGAALGHVYPETCTFGTMPCPTTVFALALLSAALPEVDRKVYIVLLAWALPAFGKCLGAMGLYEDCILFWSGVYGAVVLIWDWRISRKGGKP